MTNRENFGLFIYVDAEYYSRITLTLRMKIQRYNKDLECYNYADEVTTEGKKKLYHRYSLIADELDKLKIPYIENPVGCCNCEIHEDYEIQENETE